MSRLIVAGGSRLSGEIPVEGSKNAVLPILAAAILNGGESVIKNCPRLRDVEIMIEILKKIGCKAHIEGDVITIDSSNIKETQIPVDLAAEMRSSIIFMGPMLARCGKVTISYPGGCVTLLTVVKRWADDQSAAHLSPPGKTRILGNRPQKIGCFRTRLTGPVLKKVD